MKVDVLLGLQWGDEGKGKVVDVLTPRYDVVARFQGGPNAGHTLEFEGQKYVLRSIPSGIFQGDKVNIIGNGVVLDPALFKAEAEALELLNVLGLSERANHKPAELSGGENQRVAVARALINHPDVVLADEPSGSLDSHNKEELHKLFFELRDRLGQTFIIVTHDERLASYTDRTIRMVDGMIENEKVK